MGSPNLIPIPADGDWPAVRKAFQVLAARLGPGGSPTFQGITLEGDDPLDVESIIIADGGAWFDGEEIKFLPRYPGPRVCFTFDDQFTSQFTTLLPLMQTAGHVATMYVSTVHVGESAAYMSWSNLQTMHAAGWEIASHGHLHLPYTGMTPTEIDADMNTSKTLLEANGFTVDNHAYPGGQQDATTRQYAQKYFRSARATGNTAGFAPHYQYALPAFFGEVLSLAQHKAILDIALASNQLIIFYYHETDATLSALIRDAADYAESIGVPVCTINQALDDIGNDIIGGDGFMASQLGIRAPTIVGAVEIFSEDGVYALEVKQDTSNAWIGQEKGMLNLQTREGTNTNNVVGIKGKGTGFGQMRIYDRASGTEHYLEFSCQDGYGTFDLKGSGVAALAILGNADSDCWMFHGAAAGETRELKLYGYRTADAKRSLEIGVGVDAADQVSFDGLSTYYFDGKVKSTSAEIGTLAGVLKATAGVVAGTAALDDLNDVTAPTPTKNHVLKWNGSAWVSAAYDATYTFSIATFSDGQSSPQEIGTGVWKAAGALSFSATYNNGPPDATPHVVSSGWTDLNMVTAPTYLGPTSSAEAVNYPAVGSSVTFTLHAQVGAETSTLADSVAFYNRRHWGISTDASGFTSSDIGGLASNELSNSKAKTFTVTAGAGEYIWYCYPSRLGTVTFTVGGFEGGFESPETVSRVNDLGYTENFYCYRSTNANLGTTTVVAT